MNGRGRRAESFAAWLPFVALFAAFFWPLFVLKETFIVGDYGVQHFPWAKHLAGALRSGQFPLWTDLMARGFPFAAEGQSGPFYPPHLAYVFLPFLAVYTWSIPLHLAAGGAGMFAYARRLGLSAHAAALAATVFCFGSSFAGLYYNSASLRTLAWLPWALFFLERLRSAEAPKKAWRAAAFLTAMFLLQWTAGFPQIALYAFFYCAVHEHWAWWFDTPRAGRSLRGPALFACALAAATAAAAPVIAATAELVPLSVRHGESVAFALWGSVNPAAAVSLVFPQWGNALRVSFYAGIAPLVLLASFAGFAPQKAAWRHVFLASLFFLLSLGGFNPLYRWIVETFSVTMIRNPSKFLMPCVASLAVLAGFALDRIVAARENGESASRWKKAAYGLAGVSALLPFTGGMLRALFEPHWHAFSERYIARVIAEKGLSANPYEHYRRLMDHFFEHLGTLFSWTNPFTLVPVLLVAVSAALIHAYLARRIGRGAFLGLFWLVTAADLFAFGSTLGTGFMGNAGSVERTREPSVVAGMRRVAGEPSFSAVDFARTENETLPPSSSMAWGIAHPGGYSPLMLRRFVELTHHLGISDASLGRPSPSEGAWTGSRGLVDYLGARFIVSDRPLAWPGLRAAGGEEGLLVYENERRAPKVAGYYGWRVLPPSEGLKYLKGPAFDPLAEAVVERPPAAALSGRPPAVEHGSVFKDDLSGELSARLRMKHDGIAVVRQAAYPGWTVTVDGRRADWFVANHAFIGFDVPAGEHIIEMRYAPGWLGPSLALSVSGLLLLVFLALKGFLMR